MRQKIASALAALLLLAVMAYSGARLWALDGEIEAEKKLHMELLRQKPKATQPARGANPLARLREQNPDIIGWIAIPFTNIDYPIVQAKDNRRYLRRDLKGNYAFPGTVFMDYRCAKDGSGYSVIYGHNMKSGAMFGTLGRFADKAFFQAHPEGKLLLEDGWHSLRFFAFLTAKVNDGVIYSVPRVLGFLEDIAGRAQHYRENSAAQNSRLVALSTCSYAFRGARMVLIGEIL